MSGSIQSNPEYYADDTIIIHVSINIVTMALGSQKEYYILSIHEHPELCNISKNDSKDNTKKQNVWVKVTNCLRLSGIFIIF